MSSPACWCSPGLNLPPPVVGRAGVVAGRRADRVRATPTGCRTIAAGVGARAASSTAGPAGLAALVARRARRSSIRPAASCAPSPPRAATPRRRAAGAERRRRRRLAAVHAGRDRELRVRRPAALQRATATRDHAGRPAGRPARRRRAPIRPGRPLSLVVVKAPEHGTLAGLRYTPAPGFTGPGHRRPTASATASASPRPVRVTIFVVPRPGGAPRRPSAAGARRSARRS